MIQREADVVCANCGHKERATFENLTEKWYRMRVGADLVWLCCAKCYEASRVWAELKGGGA